MTCPECQQGTDVLIGCERCPLVCCYRCATEPLPAPKVGLKRGDCETPTDFWFRPREKKKRNPANAAPQLARAGEVGPDGYMGSRPVTHVAPGGHLWREVERVSK